MRLSCFLFGHANCPDSIMPKLELTIEKYYSELNVLYFYVGNRGKFDSLAAKAVRKVKQRYPDIQLFLVLAYHPGERPVDLWGGFDGSYYPPLENVPKQYAIVRANQYMVDTSETIICYVKHFGNTRNLLEYAQRREKKGLVQITNIAEGMGANL